MENLGPYISRAGLDSLGLTGARRVYWNLPPARLYEEALARGEAVVSCGGPLLAETGAHTGRSPNEMFVVR
jgi:phosphoenolpyruvate carboxykinase (ATP)